MTTTAPRIARTGRTGTPSMAIVQGGARVIEMKSAAAKEREFKTQLHFEVKDAEKGLVEAVFATFNKKDYDDDFTLPSAFENGAKVAISAYGHRSWMGLKPVGRGTIRVEKDRAVLEGQFFLDTIEGADTFKVVKNMAELQEWSYGYDVLATGELTEQLRQVGVRRVLEKLKVYEVCPVLVGAGIETETLSVKGKEPRDPVPPAPGTVSAEELELQVKARQEFVRFQRTRARLAGNG